MLVKKVCVSLRCCEARRNEFKSRYTEYSRVIKMVEESVKICPDCGGPLGSKVTRHGPKKNK